MWGKIFGKVRGGCGEIALLKIIPMYDEIAAGKNPPNLSRYEKRFENIPPPLPRYAKKHGFLKTGCIDAKNIHMNKVLK